MPELTTLLYSAPAAAFLVIGILITVKVLKTRCPSKEHLDGQASKVNEHLIKHTESIKSIAVSIDKNTDAVKDVIQSQGQMVERLTQSLIKGVDQ